jgi:hypothetical protein
MVAFMEKSKSLNGGAARRTKFVRDQAPEEKDNHESTRKKHEQGYLIRVISC